MIPFPFNVNQFSFFVADHLLDGQLCTNAKSDRSLLSCLKTTQCSTSEIGDAPLYNSCSLPSLVMTRRPLLQLWFLVWFQVRAISCHLTSLKSACKSTPKCTWMCWIVWWSPGAIRWPVADPGCSSRTQRRLRLRTLLSLAPLPPRTEPAGLLRLVKRWEHHQHDPQQNQSQPDRRHPPSILRAPAGACVNGMLPVQDPYWGGDWGWR